MRHTTTGPPHSRRILGALVAVVCLAPSGARAATGGGPLEIVSGATSGGAPTELWLAIVRRLHGEEAAAAAAAAQGPPAAGERSWEASIRGRRLAWEARREALAEPFLPMTPPADVRVVLGSGGAEDAFTHDARTIGFDLSRLLAEYGDAGTDENRARIDRFFAHEYTHLLQKAWLASHPQPAATPFERAELGIWLEGLGNYHSLAERWRASGGVESAASRAARAELEPVLVARMRALACAAPAEEAALVADLSMGPFTKKWGALPAALWLELEASRSPRALRDFVQAGAGAVRELARRHLPSTLAAELEAARAASARCTGGGRPEVR